MSESMFRQVPTGILTVYFLICNAVARYRAIAIT